MSLRPLICRDRHGGAGRSGYFSSSSIRSLSFFSLSITHMGKLFCSSRHWLPSCLDILKTIRFPRSSGTSTCMEELEVPGSILKLNSRRRSAVLTSLVKWIFLTKVKFIVCLLQTRRTASTVLQLLNKIIRFETGKNDLNNPRVVQFLEIKL